jgi:hypothetical protein
VCFAVTTSASEGVDQRRKFGIIGSSCEVDSSVFFASILSESEDNDHAAVQ